jgi:hypothetical protein
MHLPINAVLICRMSSKRSKRRKIGIEIDRIWTSIRLMEIPESHSYTDDLQETGHSLYMSCNVIPSTESVNVKVSASVIAPLNPTIMSVRDVSDNDCFDNDSSDNDSSGNDSLIIIPTLNRVICPMIRISKLHLLSGQ